MAYNISDDINQIYGSNDEFTIFNCDNSTGGNCSYIDPNEFYGVSSLDPEEEESLQNIIRIVVPIFFGLIFICGLAGNLLVVIVVGVNQQMRSTTNFLILNLAIADLLFTIFCVPFTACDYMSWWPFGDTWCKIVQYMIVVTAYTSVYTLVFMSFDRYLAVVHPFTSISFRTERNAIYSIIITWVVIVIFSMPVMMIHGEFRYDYQSETRVVCVFLQNDYDNMVFHVTFFATSYVIPLALICGLYLRMLIRLWTGAAPGGQVSAEGRRGRKRATRMVVIVVAIFAFCWCPIQTVNNGNVFVGSSTLSKSKTIANESERECGYWLRWSTHDEVPVWVRLVQVILLVKSLKYYQTTYATVLIQILSHLLGYMNSCVNPILYAFLSDNFRKAFRKVIYTGRGETTIANPVSVKNHNEIDKHTVTTKMSKINGEIL